MSGINQIRQRQQEWEQKRPANSGGGDNLFLKEGDIVFAHFLGTGEDDDPYMEVYYAHEIPPAVAGQGFGSFKYCPVESGHDDNYACPYCPQDGFKLKKRMMIWFHVQRILHETVKPGTQLPTADYMGRTYFVRDMNRPLLWETSAWQESPLDSIMFMAAAMTGPDGRTSLRQQQIILISSGASLQRRYKIFPYQNSAPLDAETLKKDVAIAKPVIQLLRESIAPTATQTNPSPSMSIPAAAPTPNFTTPSPAYAQPFPPPAPVVTMPVTAPAPTPPVPPSPPPAPPIPQQANPTQAATTSEYDVSPVPTPAPAPAGPEGGFAGLIAGLNKAAQPQKAMY